MGKIKNELYIIIQRMTSFVVLVFILDWIIGSGLEKLYFRQKIGARARETFGIVSSTADILILGSSSANHHYVPVIFKETLSLDTYNSGRDGIDILYVNAIIKIILQRYSPKVIILNLTPDELTNYLGYERLSALLPYCNRYPELKEIIYLKGNSERLKLISHIYPYNSTVLTLLKGIFYNNKDSVTDNGYIPLFKKIESTQIKSQPAGTNTNLEPNRIDALNELLDLCEERKIAVYLFLSPIYNYSIPESVSTKKIMEISDKKGIMCVNFINDDRFKGHDSLFQDNGHMNHFGATKYSKIIAAYILEDIRKKKRN